MPRRRNDPVSWRILGVSGIPLLRAPHGSVVKMLANVRDPLIYDDENKSLWHFHIGTSRFRAPNPCVPGVLESPRLVGTWSYESFAVLRNGGPFGTVHFRSPQWTETFNRMGCGVCVRWPRTSQEQTGSPTKCDHCGILATAPQKKFLAVQTKRISTHLVSTDIRLAALPSAFLVRGCRDFAKLPVAREGSVIVNLDIGNCLRIRTPVSRVARISARTALPIARHSRH
jgi:hypothetical protein